MLKELVKKIHSKSPLGGRPLLRFGLSTSVTLTGVTGSATVAGTMSSDMLLSVAVSLTL